MSYELELEQGLSQQLNQFQIQSLNILALDNYELEQFMQNEFAENPMLEHHPSDQPPISKANAGGWKERKEMSGDRKRRDGEACRHASEGAGGGCDGDRPSVPQRRCQRPLYPRELSG